MRRVLITGATGFIGGRLAEVASAQGIQVVALVRNWSRAARLARLPAIMAYGDTLDLGSLRQAVKGCDVVVHCAVDNKADGEAHRRSIVEGTTNVMQAALEEGVKRVVHLSSVAVYSYRAGPDAATEGGAYRYSGDVYCDAKIDAEKVALRYYRERGLPVTVLRPTIVYGPFGEYFTQYTIRLIREGRMVLVNGGSGLCNALYVDNLAEAMLLAADSDRAVGEVFHISDANATTWRQFVEGHARALGNAYLPLPEMATGEPAAGGTHAGSAGTHRSSPIQQILQVVRMCSTGDTLDLVPWLERPVRIGRAIARAVVPRPLRLLVRESLRCSATRTAPGSVDEPSLPPTLSQAEVDLYTTSVVFSIEKARKLLGYEPQIDFAEGMERTAAWIRWARV